MQLSTILIVALLFLTVTNFSDFLHHHDHIEDHNDNDCEYSLLLSQNNSTASNVTAIELPVTYTYETLVWFFVESIYKKQTISLKQSRAPPAV